MEFQLRPWTINDLDNLVKHADNFEIAKNLRDQFPHPYTKKDGLAFLERIIKLDTPNILAIDVNGEAIGGIGIHPQSDVSERNAEMGYWLAQSFWGKGIMTKAVVMMVGYAFSNWDIDRVFASPFGPNIGSQMVLEKAGFQLEARFEKTIFKNGEYLDELFYGIRRNKNGESNRDQTDHRPDRKDL